MGWWRRACRGATWASEETQPPSAPTGDWQTRRLDQREKPGSWPEMAAFGALSQ